MHCHVQDTLAILEEVNQPHPRCPKCNMLVPRRDLNGHHPITEICRRGEERKFFRLAAEEARAGDEAVLTANGKPLMAVSSFKCMGRVLSASDGDWPAVVSKLRKAQQKWARV